MTIDITELRRLFQKRGTELRPPVLGEQWNEIERNLGVKLGPDFKSLYTVMDGFVNYDYPSQLKLWGIDEIARNKQASDYLSSHHGWAVIGDFLIDSDLIVINISEAQALVKLAFDDEVLAPDLYRFMDDMVAGKFDFLS